MISNVTFQKCVVMALVVLASGCAPRPEDAVGSYDAGPVRSVDTGALKSDSQTGANIEAPHVVPIHDWIKPAIPLVEPPQVISIWFYPRKSADGLAYREGFWCHRVIKTFTWGRERAMVEQGVNYEGQISGDHLRITPGEQIGIDAQPWFLEALTNATVVPATEVYRPGPDQPPTIPPSALPPAPGSRK